VELLARGARELLGIELSQEQLAKFQLYYEELVRRNEQVNLTAITEYSAVQTRHFLDSLALASPALRGDPPDKPFDLSKASLIDIGAGAGFPGLPLKILYPQMHLTLVESVGKKATFLREIAATLELSGVTVVTDRAEEVGQSKEHRAKYDLATGRAVAALAVLAEYCIPLVKRGGLFIAPKKGELTVELTTAQKAVTILGGKQRATPQFVLPGESDPRLLVVIDKVKQTPSTYPRRVGTPAKSPIL
jgi:16S rRNA (guanine527-N7)-methyltransferase